MKKIFLSLIVLLVCAFSAHALTLSNSYVLSDGVSSFYDTGASAYTLIDTDGTDDTAIATLFFEMAGLETTNTFGLYTYSIVDDKIVLGSTLQIFEGADTDGESSKVTFDFENGTITSYYGTIDLIGNYFGFYLGSNGNVWYSQEELNTDGYDHFLSYDTSDVLKGELSTVNVVLAIEDLPNGGDEDFRDMVVGISDIAPVPEPATLVLLGSGLVGLAFLKRRKS